MRSLNFVNYKNNFFINDITIIKLPKIRNNSPPDKWTHLDLSALPLIVGQQLKPLTRLGDRRVVSHRLSSWKAFFHILVRSFGVMLYFA